MPGSSRRAPWLARRPAAGAGRRRCWPRSSPAATSRPRVRAGKARSRCSGAAIPTRRNRSSVFARASAAVTGRCARIASATWSPTRISGCSEDIGSWKIIATSAPRTARIAASSSASRSRPCSSAWPVDGALPCSRRISASAVVLLPQPLSPTRPKRLAWFEARNLRRSTARVASERDGAGRARPATMRAQRCSLGSSASRSPSPMKLKLATASVIARPGNTASHGSTVKSLCALVSMLPQLAAGGWMP